MDTIKQVELQKNSWIDERGWGVNPLQALGFSEKITGNLHIVSLEPGAVRGNHLHTNATEWILVFGGKASIVWRPKNASSVRQISGGESKPALFEIPSDIEHAVVNDSNVTIYVAVFYDTHKPETVLCSPLLNQSA